MDIGVGDWVECLRAPIHPFNGAQLTVGAVYRVVWVGPRLWAGRVHPALRVENDPTPENAGWYVSDFRRHGPGAGAFNHLLAPTDFNEPVEITPVSPKVEA